MKTLETVASDVLKGLYGPELQRILADEISKCVNQMSSAGMLSIHSREDRTVLKLRECETDEIIYSDNYLVEWILSGKYGREAMLNFHSFIKSLENKSTSPAARGGVS